MTCHLAPLPSASPSYYASPCPYDMRSEPDSQSCAVPSPLFKDLIHSRALHGTLPSSSSSSSTLLCTPSSLPQAVVTGEASGLQSGVLLTPGFVGESILAALSNPVNANALQQS